MQTPTQNTQATSIPKKIHHFGLRTIMDLFDVSPAVAIGALSGAGLLVVAAIFFFIHSAPPTTITITTGAEGSSFQKNALKYAAILEKNGVKVKVLTSEGSAENLKRLTDPKSHVDVGMVQDGIQNANSDQLVSLGSISYQPVLIFYRGKEIDLLSEFKNKKISIGPMGSGTRTFALNLLSQNGIKENESTPLLDLDAEDAAKALGENKIEAAFIMSETASTDILHKLLRSQEIHLYSFKQATAYSRKFNYLNPLDLAAGAIDLGLNIPPHDISLVGPTVELIAKKDLHPALSDLLLEAATQVHNHPGMYQRRGEFPNPSEHEIPISEDASRFYKSGKSFFYRTLPFWLASWISRILVVFVPMLVILIPSLKTIPAFFRWRSQMKIHRRYRELLTLETAILTEKDPVVQTHLRKEFDSIEAVVNQMKVKASFADQYYGLRGHIGYVRNIIENQIAAKSR